MMRVGAGTAISTDTRGLNVQYYCTVQNTQTSCNCPYCSLLEWSVMRVSSAHHWLHSTAHDLSECSHSMVQLVLVLLVTSVLGGYQQDLGQSYV